MDSSDTITQTLHDLRTTDYAALSAACIVLYEYLITLDDEIHLIWNSSWSSIKILFLLNRYHALVAVAVNVYGLLGPSTLTQSFCNNFFRWQGWTEIITCILADGILQLRLYAMYYLDKRILALMLTCFGISMFVAGGILTNTLSNIHALAVPSPLGGMICYPSHLPERFYLFWIPLLLFECLLWGLAMMRGLQTLRYTGSFGRKLMIILIRDSLVYFFAIFMTYTVSLLVHILARVTLLEVPMVFTVALPCVLSNRVVLNIREAVLSTTVFVPTGYQ